MHFDSGLNSPMHLQSVMQENVARLSGIQGLSGEKMLNKRSELQSTRMGRHRVLGLDRNSEQVFRYSPARE